MSKPLEGLKVVELSTYVAAPGAARILADLGADVIKVESFAGDQWRISGKKTLHTDDSENPMFDVYNVGKKSICINIKNEKGKAVLLKLIGNADIFITNTRAKSLRKLGLDGETLTSQFPRLIYATLDGFGSKGPDADSPGFDNISFWGRSGFARDVPIETDSSYPMPVISGVGDCVTGGFLVSGILAALYKREKTGTGDIVNVSLYGTAIWCTSSMIIRSDPKYGESFPKNDVSGDPLTYNYKCADGEWCNISVRAYDKDAPVIYSLLGIAGQVEKLGDVNELNYMTFDKQLIPLIRDAMLKKTSNEWMELFRSQDLVIGKLPHFKDVLNDEQAWENDFIEKIQNRNGSESTIACTPIQLKSNEKKTDLPAPLIAENTVEIMQNLGYSTTDISNLRSEKAIQ